jgi:hypothetical protein
VVTDLPLGLGAVLEVENYTPFVGAFMVGTCERSTSTFTSASGLLDTTGTVASGFVSAFCFFGDIQIFAVLPHSGLNLVADNHTITRCDVCGEACFIPFGYFSEFVFMQEGYTSVILHGSITRILHRSIHCEAVDLGRHSHIPTIHFVTGFFGGFRTELAYWAEKGDRVFILFDCRQSIHFVTAFVALVAPMFTVIKLK